MLEMIGQAYLWMLEHLLAVNILFSLLIVFFQRRNPTTVWAWLLLLYFIPVLGFVLYLILGQNFHKDRMFKMKEIEGELKYAVRRQEESIYRRKLKLRDPEQERFKSLILYNLNEGEAVLTDNNDIRIYTDGEEKFQALLREMEEARNYIHLQYYIIRNDELWQEMEKVLVRKVRQGVEVRVLFDSMGCRRMRRSDWERLRSAGIKVAEGSKSRYLLVIGHDCYWVGDSVDYAYLPVRSVSIEVASDSVSISWTDPGLMYPAFYRIYINDSLWAETEGLSVLFTGFTEEGRYKAEVLAERVEQINAHCKVDAVCEMLTESNCSALVDGSSYVADAIDSLAAKAALAVYCTGKGLPIVSAMGAGNRAGWCDFRVADIYKTDYDPLAKKFRKMMKERGVRKLDVCFTQTPPVQTGGTVASMPFAPAACGVRMGAYIVERLLV